MIEDKWTITIYCPHTEYIADESIQSILITEGHNYSFPNISVIRWNIGGLPVVSINLIICKKDKHMKLCDYIIEQEFSFLVNSKNFTFFFPRIVKYSKVEHNEDIL